MEALVDKVLAGNRRAIAKAISLIENSPERAKAFIRQIYSSTGSAIIVGITGPPGSGKSTLVNSLIVELRRRNQSVGVIAVDPTSPFGKGGALLGDRIRMISSLDDPKVFIRSMGTRGGLGGLSRATTDAIRVLDAGGCDIILVETVGAGQSEVEIVRIAHTTLVLSIPGTGDAIQAIKAGILEIADIYVVNKADLPGAETLVNELQLLLSLEPAGDATSIKKWKIPVISTSNFPKRAGISKLVDAILEHNQFLNHPDNKEYAAIREFERRKNEIKTIIRYEVFENMLENLINKQQWENILQRVINKEEDPYTAAQSIMDPLFREE